MSKREIKNPYEKTSLYARIFRSQGIFCEQIYKNLNIHWDGNITGCCYDMDKNLSFGNASDSSLYEIWHGEKMSKLREAFREQKFRNLPYFCQNCRANLV